MAELIKQWNDGESFTVAYDGDRDGSAVVTSGVNEGIDREQTIVVATTNSNPKQVAVAVTQVGLRERFITSDGLVFCVTDGGRFAVLKEGAPDEPETPTVPMGVSIATSDGQFITTTQWSNQGTAVGVCVKTDEFAIIIDLDVQSKRWHSSNSNISGVPAFTNANNVGNYKDGQAYTDLMYAKSSSVSYAAGYARSRKITIAGVEYVGYLGSTGEWQALMAYDDDIMAAFSKLGKSFSGSTSSRNIWTSCQYNNSNAWRFSFTSSGFGSFGSTTKTSSAYVKVLFRYE